ILAATPGRVSAPPARSHQPAARSHVLTPLPDSSQFARPGIGREADVHYDVGQAPEGYGLSPSSGRRRARGGAVKRPTQAVVSERLPGAAPEFRLELAVERVRNARRINLMRFSAVSAFFLLFFVLGTVLGMPAWKGNLELFALYWVATAAAFW